MTNLGDYLQGLTDPAAIEEKSLAIIESESARPLPFEENEWPVVRRMIHATADFELLELVRFHADAVEAGVDALIHGGLIVTDTQMVRHGIPTRRTDQLGCAVRCFIDDPRVVDSAKARGVTRAMAAVDLALDEYEPRVFVIGNAPTALLRLMQRLEEGSTHPRLIVGMPVGFVNAEESKTELLRREPAPFITVIGRKGGSTMAAAAVNALLEMALARKPDSTPSR